MRTYARVCDIRGCHARTTQNKARCIRVYRTYQPKKRQRSKVHGFRKRMKTADGRNVIKRRRAKGRRVLSA